MRHKSLLRCAKALSVFLAVVLVLIVAIPGEATGVSQPQYCSNLEELTSYMLEQLGAREQFISVTIPDTMPEATANNPELFMQILRSDYGFVRWGYQGGAVRVSKKSGNTTFEYMIRYYTTKEQDDNARSLAAEIVDGWDLDGLTDRKKVDMLRDYVSDSWRYDESLENRSADSTLATGIGTCLGQVLASQLILDELGIASQTVHGVIKGNVDEHILLLVNLGKWWYTFDPSDFSRDDPLISAYLRQSYRGTFMPEAEYLTDSFKSAHPMSQSDLS